MEYNYITPWLEEKASGIVQVKSGDQWISLIDPSKLQFSVYDLDAGNTTGRNLEGTLLRDRVAIKEKLTMEFPPMQAADFTLMLGLVANQTFMCKYFSLKTGAWREVEMYVGDRDAEAYYNYDADNSYECMWQNINFNFIEV